MGTDKYSTLIKKLKEEGKISPEKSKTASLTPIQAYNKSVFDRHWNNYINSVSDIYSTYNSRFYNQEGNPIDAYRENAVAEYDEYVKQNENIAINRSLLTGLLNQNKDIIDTTTYTKATDFLTKSESDLENIGKTYEFYSSFGSADAYNAWKVEEEAKEAEKQKIMGADDFAEYSQIGANIKNPEYVDALGWLQIGTWRPFGEDVGNIVTFSRDNLDEINKRVVANDGRHDDTILGDYRYKFMTDDEVAIYNYYLGKGDSKSAKEYLLSLDEQLNQRFGYEISRNVSGKRFLEMTFAVGAGLDQWATGMKELFNGGEAKPITPTQYASSTIREELDGGWGVTYDAANATGNMLPSILIGSLPIPGARVAGAATLGLSAAGNAKAEMLRLGYSEGQAWAYGTLIGASEAALQYLMSGIEGLGGKAAGKIASKFALSVDNALAKIAIRYGTNIVSEGLEEAIQTTLEPIYKALVTGEEFTPAELDEIVYSALLGGIVAGGFGVPGSIGTTAKYIGSNYATGKALNSKGISIENLAEVSGKSLDSNSYGNRLAQRYSGKSGTYKLGKVSNAISRDMTRDTIEKTLVMKGVSESDAKKIASATVDGGELSHGQKQIAKKYSREISGAAALSKLMYDSSIMALAEAKVIKDAQSPQNSTEFAESADKDNKYEVSIKSVNALKSTGEEIEIQGVASNNLKGELKLLLSDGKTVSASDVEFASDEDAAKYGMVSAIGASPETAKEIDYLIENVNGIERAKLLSEIKAAYRAGLINDKSALDGIEIPDEAKQLMFNRGRIDAASRADKAPATATKKAAQNNDVVIEKNGIKYHFKKKGKYTTIQKNSIELAEVISELSSVLEINLYESYVDEKGERWCDVNGIHQKAPNGWFANGNEIYIDINAGSNGEGVMLYTVSHEIAHYIRRWNPKAFKEIGDYLIEQWLASGKSSADINKLIEDKKKQIEWRQNLKRKADQSIKPLNDAELFDRAYEDVVCDAMSEMFADAKSYEKFAELKNKKPKLLELLGKAINTVLEKLKKLLRVYGDNQMVATEARYVRDLTEEAYNKLRDMYIKAFVEADNAYLDGKGESDNVADSDTPLNSERDTQYFEAVESGDMETAQRMVDEAARVAGYTIKAYHGTTNQEEHSKWNAEKRMWDTEYTPIRVFKRQYEGQVGHFFSADEDNAGGYGSYLYSVYLMMKKPLVINCNGQSYSNIAYDGKEMDTYEWAEYALKQRYDGVVFQNIRDGVDYGAMSTTTTDYVIFDSNRIKSADPVTYDDEGKVIPLSQRFDSTKRDIRYSEREIIGPSGINYGKGVYLDSTLLSGLNDEERVEMVKEYLKEQGGSVFNAYDNNGKAVDVHLVESTRKFKNKSGKRVPVNKHMSSYLSNPLKQDAITLIDEMVTTAKFENKESPHHPHDWLDNNGKNDWDIWTTYIQDKENTVWKAYLQIANSSNGEKILYEIHPIEMVEGVKKLDTATTDNILADSDEIVNSDEEISLNSERVDPSDDLTTREGIIEALKTSKIREEAVTQFTEYTKDIERLSKKMDELDKVSSDIDDAVLAGGDEATLDKLNERKVKLEKQIATLNAIIKRREASKTMRHLIEQGLKQATQKGIIAGTMSQGKRDAAILRRYKERMEAKLEKTKDSAKRQRADDIKRYNDLVEKNREAREKGAEKRKSSALRTKIKNFKDDLQKSLLKPTDGKYIPENLALAMIEVCELIDTDTELYHNDGTINKAQERRNATKMRLEDLAGAYEELGESNSEYVFEYDESVKEYLKHLKSITLGKSLSELGFEELETMYDILRSIRETIIDSKKLIGTTEAKTIYQTANEIGAEQEEIITKRKKGKEENSGKLGRAQKTTNWLLDQSLSPMRGILRMVNYNEDSALYKLAQSFEEGERAKWFWIMNAYKAFDDITSGENAKLYEDALYKEHGGKKYIDSLGRRFGVSKMQMMQAILSYERELANPKLKHISKGGLSFVDLKLLEKGDLRGAKDKSNLHTVAEAVDMVKLFESELANDSWAQVYMELARKFFNETAKETLNKTMLTIKHRLVATEENYIPYEVDDKQIVQEISDINGNNIQKTIESFGMLKSIVDSAPQALYITGLNNILERHIEQVGTFYGLAIPVRNFNKVWNAKTDEGFGDMVKARIEAVWGKDGHKLIEQMIKDIQAPRADTQGELYKKIKSGYIGATFVLNGSVVMKQIGSLFSATSMLDWSITRNPAGMIANLIYTMAHTKEIAAEVDKYTATAWKRRNGLSDGELHTLATEGKRLKIIDKLNKLPAGINPTKWITFMDYSVALSLWKYAKEDTAKKTGLEGDELLKETARFYDILVENTQSTSDVLHRPEIQKSKNILAEFFGMFKTDLYQMAGRIQTDFGRFMAEKNIENAKRLGKTLGSTMMSAVWGQLMTTVFALLRYKVDAYRDDDDELTVESWLKRQAFDLGGDLIGFLFPLAGSEIITIIENTFYGDTYDLVDNVSVSAINDLVSAIQTLGHKLIEWEAPTWNQWRKLLVSVLQLFGIPANNILRFVESIMNHAKDIANGEFFSFEAGK